MKKLIVLLMLFLTACNSNLGKLLEPTPTVEVIEEVVVEIPEVVIEEAVLVPSVSAWSGSGTFYFNGCAPNHKGTFFARVDNLDVYGVTLYFRFIDLEGEGYTEWHAKDMDLNDNGQWSATLLGNDLKGFIRNFEFMTMEYQAVVWSVPNIVGLRTDVQYVIFEVCQE